MYFWKGIFSDLLPFCKVSFCLLLLSCQSSLYIQVQILYQIYKCFLLEFKYKGKEAVFSPGETISCFKGVSLGAWSRHILDVFIRGEAGYELCQEESYFLKI